MPNHVDQKVIIRGDKFLVHHLHEQVQQGNFCQTVIPMPFEYHRDQNWYNWRLENWGTKWGTYEATEIECNVPSENVFFRRDMEGHGVLSFRCNSAWSPPVKVWDALVALGLSVESAYLDESYNYWGYYMDGSDAEESGDRGPVWEHVERMLGATFWTEFEDEEDAA